MIDVGLYKWWYNINAHTNCLLFGLVSVHVQLNNRVRELEIRWSQEELRFLTMIMENWVYRGREKRKGVQAWFIERGSPKFWDYYFHEDEEENLANWASMGEKLASISHELEIGVHVDMLVLEELV